MKFLILSVHKGEFNPEFALWWAPNCAGYTVDVDKAGRYNSEDCADVIKHGDGVMVPEDVAMKKIRQVVPRGEFFAEFQQMKKTQKSFVRSL